MLTTPRYKTADYAGATLLETALILVTTLALTLFSVQLFLYWRRVMTIDTALAETGRWAKLGLQNSGASRESAIEDYFRRRLQSYQIKPSNLTLTICPVIDLNCSTPSAAGAGELFALEATENDFFLLGMYALPVKANVIARNEPE